MTRKSIGGLICPIVTPIDDDENLAKEDLHRLLDYVIPYMDGIFPLGSSGQFALLSDKVADEVVDVTVQHVAGCLPVYLGISDSCTSSVIRNLQRARCDGVDYVVVCSSYFYPFNNQEALVNHFRRVADASPKPVILYNCPQNTGILINTESTAILADHPNIVGIKDSSGDMFLFQELLNLRSENFFVMQGREQLASASLWLGADGIVSALPNLAPKLLRNLFDAVKANDRVRALMFQSKVTHLALIFSQNYWLSALMAATHELGIGNGRAGSPLPECTLEQRNRIRQMMHVAGIL